MTRAKHLCLADACDGLTPSHICQLPQMHSEKRVNF